LFSGGSSNAKRRLVVSVVLVGLDHSTKRKRIAGKVFCVLSMRNEAGLCFQKLESEKEVSMS